MGCFGGPQNDAPGGNRILREASNLKKKRINFDLIPPRKMAIVHDPCVLYIKSACNFFMVSVCVAFISKIFSSTSLPLGITAPFARRCSSKAVLGDQRDLGSVILLLVALRISRDLKSLVVWRSKRTLRNTGSFTLQLYGLMIFRVDDISDPIRYLGKCLKRNMGFSTFFKSDSPLKFYQYLAILCALFGDGENVTLWKAKWPPTTESKGHFESLGSGFLSNIHHHFLDLFFLGPCWALEQKVGKEVSTVFEATLL